MLVAERVQALGVLYSLKLKNKLSAEQKQETHLLNNEEKVKWIKDYVDRATAVA
jgi:hypothetical protein